jgi:ParB family chromosome partitioning protein
MEGKALGKGLSALIPERKIVDSGEMVARLKTGSIIDNRLQPRTVYDDDKLNDLKASIKEKGVLQPILVRSKGSQYEVIAGERRLKAARALGLDEIPAIIRDVSDQEAFVIALIENIQREELNPIEEAEAYHKMIEEFGYTQEAVAQSVGKDRTTVTNLLRILKLPTDMRGSISGGTSHHRRLRNYSLTNGIQDNICGTVQIQFLHKPCAMCFNCIRAEIEHSCHIFIGPALGQQLQNLFFSFCQKVV